MYAGSRMPPARKFARAIRGFGEPGEATVIGAKPFATSVRHAALLNSVHAQVLEWEDWTFIVHSGASIVPTALAAGELAGASGKEVLTAIVAGNEILARAGEVLTDVLHTGNAVAVHQIETPLDRGQAARPRRRGPPGRGRDLLRAAAEHLDPGLDRGRQGPALAAGRC